METLSIAHKEIRRYKKALYGKNRIFNKEYVVYRCGRCGRLSETNKYNFNKSLGGCRYCYAWPSKKDTSVPNQVFFNYKNGARRRNLEFEIDLDQFISICNEPCYYCGVEKYNTAKYRKCTWDYNGIDRIDSSIGYVSDNIVPCCGLCNRMKSDMDLDKFIEHIYKINGYLNDGNK